MATTKLFRPVGQRELDLIAASGFKAFPPRLPEQPIFYPVLGQEYAEQIARNWNTKDERSGYVGYVTEFVVESNYLNEFEIRRVGGQEHLEYWIPAEYLEEFNRHICAKLESLRNYRETNSAAIPKREKTHSNNANAPLEQPQTLLQSNPGAGEVRLVRAECRFQGRRSACFHARL